MALGLLAGLAIVGGLVLEPGQRSAGIDSRPRAAAAVDLPDTLATLARDTLGIRVLNGTDIDYLASDVQRFLLGKSGQDLVFLAPGQPDNALRPTDGSSFEETVIAAHIPDLSAATYVASLLRLGSGNVVWELDPALQAEGVDITVYLGLDMEEIRGHLVPYLEEEEGP